MLTLYYAPGSSTMASHIALEEAGAEYDVKFVDEDAGEQHTEAYLRINPRGKVPALRLADGTVLVENVAIQTYVARTHPDAKLLPGDPVGEGGALSLMSFFASAVHPAFAHVWRPGRYTDEPAAEPGIRAKGRETFFEGATGLLRDHSAVLTVPSTVLRLVPMPPNAPAATAAITAAIRPYSSAVTPRLSVWRAIAFLRMVSIT